MSIKQKFKIILATIGMMALSTPVALSTEPENQRLICNRAPKLVRAETQNYILYICGQETSEGDIPIIYEARNKKRKNYFISVSLVRETDEPKMIYVARNGDLRYEVSFPKRRLLVTRRGRKIIQEKIIHWYNRPGVANTCQF